MCLPNFKNYKLKEFRDSLVENGKITQSEAWELKERSDTLLTISVIVIGLVLFILGILTGFVIGRL
jgi:hypothetical protein